MRSRSPPQARFRHGEVVETTQTRRLIALLDGDPAAELPLNGDISVVLADGAGEEKHLAHRHAGDVVRHGERDFRKLDPELFQPLFNIHFRAPCLMMKRPEEANVLLRAARPRFLWAGSMAVRPFDEGDPDAGAALPGLAPRCRDDSNTTSLPHCSPNFFDDAAHLRAGGGNPHGSLSGYKAPRPESFLRRRMGGEFRLKKEEFPRLRKEGLLRMRKTTACNSSLLARN